MSTDSPFVLSELTNNCEASKENAAPQPSKANESSARRPTWDLKGRLADMEELVTMLKGEINMSKANVSSITSQLGSSRSARDSPARTGSASRLSAARRSTAGTNDKEHQDEISKLQSEHKKTLQEADEKLQSAMEEIEALKRENTSCMEDRVDASQIKEMETALAEEQQKLEASVAQLAVSVAEVDRLTDEIETLRSTCTVVEGKLQAAQTTVSELHDMKEALEEDKATLEDENIVLKEDLAVASARAADAASSEAHYVEQLKDSAAENDALRTSVTRKEDQIEKMERAMEGQANQLTTLEDRAAELASARDALVTKNREQEEELMKLKKRLDNAQSNVFDLQEAARADEMVRRDLHNTILELKGNIRVFCRIRPLLGVEAENQATIPYSLEDLGNQRLTLGNGGKSYDFKFDKVYPPTARQADVFHDISQLVQSALDGYNVCIFAYGQTGSGKTYTMEGDSSSATLSDQSGMIPRAVWQVFDTADSLGQKGWEYHFEATYLEIYNETIVDLLGDPKSKEKKKHDIKHGKDGSTTVTGLTTEIVTRPEEVQILLAKASRMRSVASTNMNDVSSRSHSVFTLRLVGTNKEGKIGCSGMLNLIDLAGSERLSKSGVTGARAKEAMAINKSLSALSDVMVALGNKAGHIPYRNSKLTFLLKNSLGGRHKMLMFANLSPLNESVQESLCSLRFAANVNSIELGRAARSVYKNDA